jgi:hypothetical protein
MTTLDRLKRELTQFVERLLVPTRFHRLYPGRVVSQTGNVVDVVLDDPTMVVPPVVLRHGLPGWHVEVPASKPFAALWEPTTDATMNRHNGGTRRVARVDDTTGNGSLTVAAVPVPLPVPTSSLVITYTPPSGAPTVITVLGLPPGLTVVGGPAALVGTITSGKAGLEA